MNQSNYNSSLNDYENLKLKNAKNFIAKDLNSINDYYDYSFRNTYSQYDYNKNNDDLIFPNNSRNNNNYYNRSNYIDKISENYQKPHYECLENNYSYENYEGTQFEKSNYYKKRNYNGNYHSNYYKGYHKKNYGYYNNNNNQYINNDNQYINNNNKYYNNKYLENNHYNQGGFQAKGKDLYNNEKKEVNYNPKANYAVKRFDCPNSFENDFNKEIERIKAEIREPNSIDINKEELEQNKIEEIKLHEYLTKNYRNLINLNKINKDLFKQVQAQRYPRFFIIKSFNEEDFHKVNNLILINQN